MKRRRGRPTGYVMSIESREAIAKAKTGKHHSEATKSKISKGVKRYHEVGAPIDIIMDNDLSIYGKHKDSSGYVTIYITNPEVGEPTYHQRYHVALVEKVLGRKLLAGEEVHHWGDKDNNDLKLLALCKNRREHMLLDKIKERLHNKEI